MDNASKFLFDDDFDANEERRAKREARAEKTYDETELTATRDQAYAEGVIAGLEQARQELESQISHSLVTVEKNIEVLQEQLQEQVRQVEVNAIMVAKSIATTLTSELMSKFPDDELDALIEEALQDALAEPRIVVRVHESQLEGIQTRAGDMANRNGFEGKLVLLPDDSLSPGDAHVEWADGGIERKLSDIEADITTAINRYVSDLTTKSDSPLSAPDSA